MTINTQELYEYLLPKLRDSLNGTSYCYTTFGKEVEPFVTDILIDYFQDKPEYEEHFIAPTKNDFPDFKLNSSIAIEIKAAWNTSNPENDMGTLNSWQKKIREYGDNIYYIFVRYDCDDGGTVNHIIDIYIEKVYHMIGKNGDGYLKYREKDGNLRPKSWSNFENNVNHVTDYVDFQNQLDETDKYRAYRIASKKIEVLLDEPDFMRRLYTDYFSEYSS